MEEETISENSCSCCSSGVDRGSCVDDAAGREQNYGIGTVDSYGSMGDRVCGLNQNILKIISCLICFP